MCEPVSIMTALSIASTAAAGFGQVAGYQEQKAMAKATRNAANNAYAMDLHGITTRQMQEQDAAAERKLENQREYDAARASAIVNADQAGVRGLSVDALLNDLAGQQASRQKAVDTNTSWQIAQLQDEKLGADATRQSRIASAPKPSATGLLLKVGGTAVSGLDAYKSRTGQQQTPGGSPRPKTKALGT